MLAGCGRAGDYAGDPTSWFVPIEAAINFVQRTLTLFYDTTNDLLPGSTINVYANGVIIDKNGSSGKQYTLSVEDLQVLYAIALAAVAPGVDSPDYDPLCGEVRNMFKFKKDFIPWQDFYVCPPRPLCEQHYGKQRCNYISPEMKQQGFTVTRGTVVQQRAGRRRLVDRKIVQKPVGQPRYVLKIDDYRYFTQFDQQAFQTNPGMTVPCQPYRFPSTATTVFATIPEGKSALSDLSQV